MSADWLAREGACLDGGASAASRNVKKEALQCAKKDGQ